MDRSQEVMSFVAKALSTFSEAKRLHIVGYTKGGCMSIKTGMDALGLTETLLAEEAELVEDIDVIHDEAVIAKNDGNAPLYKTLERMSTGKSVRLGDVRASLNSVRLADTVDEYLEIIEVER